VNTCIEIGCYNKMPDGLSGACANCIAKAVDHLVSLGSQEPLTREQEAAALGEQSPGTPVERKISISRECANHITARSLYYDAQSGGGLQSIGCSNKGLQDQYSETAPRDNRSMDSFLDFASTEGWEVYAVDNGCFYLSKIENNGE